MIGILALPDLSEFLLFAVNDASNVLRVSSRVFFLFFSSIVAFSDHRQSKVQGLDPFCSYRCSFEELKSVMPSE